MPDQIHISTRTYKSDRRDLNEDSMAHDLKRGFFILADGIGSEAGGHFASKLVIERLSKILSDAIDTHTYDRLTLEKGKKIFEEAIQTVHLELIKEVRAHSDFEKAGTTLCSLLFLEEGGLCVHAGDSRAYLFRKGELRALTKDHTLYNQGLEEGTFDEKSADSKTLNNIIVKALGMSETCAPSFSTFTPQVKDFYLICSDGLTDVVEDEIIAKILFQDLPIEVKTSRLVEKAKEQGAKDDISVMLLEMIGEK